MSLRSKIVILLSAVVLLYAGLDHLIQRTFVFESFVDLERSSAEKELARVVQAIRGEIEHLQLDCDGLATMASTRALTLDRGDVRDAQILAQVLESERASLLYLCDAAGRVAFGRARQDGCAIELHDFPSEALSLTHPLLALGEVGNGVFLTERGPMLVATRDVVSEARREKIGTLILGRLVDVELARRLAQQTSVSFQLWSLDDTELPEALRAIKDEVTASTTPVQRALDEQQLGIHSWIADVQEAPALLISARLERAVTQRGRTAVRYALISTIAAGLLLMLVLLNLIQRTVLRPIGALTTHAVEIGRSEDFTKRIESRRDDEVGILARELDSMIEKLAQSRAALVKAARAAGMSEIATGVLHNIGNVLNSVNVSATLVESSLRDSGTKDLANVVKALEPVESDLPRFFAEDPRAKHLLPLLRSIAAQSEQERTGTRGELATLMHGIEHIKDLIASQQSYARRSILLEVVDLGAQVEAALVMTGQMLGGSGGIEVVRQFEALPSTKIDRHRLLEILVNLIQNARQSISEAGSKPARIDVRLVRVNAERARIEVADNGTGIAPENLARVFTHGFTTKKTGHGFGLHASANAATEMGGKLTVHSPGVGRGATFVLELPLQISASQGALV